MKVRELMQALEAYDPEAEIMLMTQENWAFEHEIEGVASREELGEAEEGRSSAGEPGDVFLVEGRQVRYGSKAAWRAAHR